MPLFSEGFLKYFTSSKFCDMTLVVRNKEYKTHRIILVYNSKYFAKKLSEPQYAQQKYIRFVLDISDPNNLFPLILRYVYEGHVKVTDENCVPLLSLANFLEIEDLKKRIATFLSTSIGRKNVLFVLKRAMDFGQEEVKKQCILVLAHNFSRIAAGEPLEAPASASASSHAHGFAGLAAHASASARSHLRSGSYNGVAPRDGPIVGFASATPSAGLVPGSHSSVNLGSAGIAGLSSSAGSGKTHTRMGSSNASLSTSPPGGSSAGAHGASKWTSVAPSAVAGTVYAEQESPFRSLSVELMLTLLSHPGLAVMNENLVYKSVVDYIKAKGNELTEADRTALYEQVRFPFLNYNQLQDVIKNNEVPHRLLAEALIVRLGSFESPNTNKANKASLQKRTNCGMFFEYSSDFDERGVLHWIATQGHTSEWVNPIRYGVKVTASSSEKGAASDILEIKPNECWTKDVPSSWFAFDLGKNRQLLLTYYTLRHGSNSRQDCLRSWALQCSDDGLEWETIKRHNECVMNSNFATASWPVMCTNPHRYFRVLQTGHNSTNKNFFSLSGIEFYGDFYQNMT